MRRREFITALGGAALWPLTARAQPTKIPRIGFLWPRHSEGADASRATLNGLLEGLHDLGYTEGQNIMIEREFDEANVERLRELAANLVRRQVVVIVAFSTTAALAAKQATSIIPIIAIGMADPVEDGLVASLRDQAGMLRELRF
jgi:putative ABC transport system substrate-binding protein